MSNEIAAKEAQIDQSALTVEEINNLAFSLQHGIEAITKAMDGATKASLQRTNSADWKDMGGKYYLEASGCQKIRSVWGIYFRDKEVIRENYQDGHYGYYCTGKVGSQFLDRFYGKEVVIEVDGGRSSKDGFFGKEPDPMDVRKSAISNLEARGIASFLGLKNFTAEDLTRNGIDVTKIKKVEYGSGTKGGSVATEDEKSLQVKVFNILVKLAGSSEEAKISPILQSLTKFKGKDGKEVAGVASVKSLTGKRLEITYDKAKQALALKGESETPEPGAEG